MIQHGGEVRKGRWQLKCWIEADMWLEKGACGDCEPYWADWRGTEVERCPDIIPTNEG